MNLNKLFEDFCPETQDLGSEPSIIASRPSRSEIFEFDVKDSKLLSIEVFILRYMLEKVTNELQILNCGFINNVDKLKEKRKSKRYNEIYNDPETIREHFNKRNKDMANMPLEMVNDKVDNDM